MTVLQGCSALPRSPFRLKGAGQLARDAVSFAGYLFYGNMGKAWV